jgi:hypothetical protein
MSWSKSGRLRSARTCWRGGFVGPAFLELALDGVEFADPGHQRGDRGHDGAEPGGCFVGKDDFDQFTSTVFK